MSDMEHHARHEQNTVQIESAMVGDEIKFNNLKRPATVTQIQEHDRGKTLYISGERTGKYELTYYRDVGVIDFTRTSKNKRRIILHQFIIVNRQPRPFHDYEMSPDAQSVKVDAETAFWVLKLYRDSFIHNGNEHIALTDENKEEYRNIVVLTFQVQATKSQFEFVGPEIQLIASAFDWALENIDFTKEEKDQLKPLRDNIKNVQQPKVKSV